MNREESIEYGKERSRRTRDRLAKLKAAAGCLHCGEDDHRCLDFHHKNPKVKFKPVSQMNTYSWKRILAEVAKCEVLCANCHRKLGSV